MENLIELNNVSKNFENLEVLRGLSLHIQKGQAYGFLGRNSAGKTTAIKIIMGMLAPTNGDVKLLGHNPWKISNQLKQKVGYISQSSIIPGWLSVQELLLFSSRMYPDWNFKLVDKLVQQFQLSKTRKVDKLSGGMQKLLALIIAIGKDPEILILDEPFTGLDPISRRDLLDNMIELFLLENKTLFFSSHIISDVEKIISRVGILKFGKLFLEMDMDDLKQSIKQVQLEFTGEAPDKIDMNNVITQKRVNNIITMIVKELNKDMISDLKKSYNAQVTILDLNLEDIFTKIAR